MKRSVIVILVLALTVSCTKEQVTTSAERVTDATTNAVQNVADRLDNSVPMIGNRPTREEMERERFNTRWRNLQSFRAKARARAAAAQNAAAQNAAAQNAAGQPGNPPVPAGPPIAFVVDPKFAESFKGVDPGSIVNLPVRVPIKGDVAGPSVLRAQVLLDRAGFSVGALDGRWGKNSEIAVYWFQRERNLEPTGDVDQRTYEALAGASGNPQALLRYALTAEDVAGPFTKLPEDVYEKEKLKCLCYESLTEALSEKFHATAELLEMLNPGAKINSLQAGQELLVPNVRPWTQTDVGPDVMKIVISVQGSYLHAYDANDNLLFHAPTTLGSKYDPSPNETVKVGNIVQKPHFHYQPKLFHEVPDSDPEANLQPGPNSPVGVVWMALSKPHFGIHGTGDPDSIGYASSHGCVRLTNWDANDLSHRTKQGIPVEFVDTRHEPESGT